MSVIEELKPCPFCGGAARLEKMGWPHHVYCTTCGVRITGIGTGAAGEIDACEKWNRRKENSGGWIPEEERLPKCGVPVHVTVWDSQWISDYGNDYVPEEDKTYHPETRYVSVAIRRDNEWIVLDFEDPGNYMTVPVGGSHGDDLEVIYSKVLAWAPMAILDPYWEGEKNEA